MSLAIATFFAVLLRSIQQQNVIGGHYITAVVTSYGIAVFEVMVIVGVVEVGLIGAVWMGTGGALGVTVGMWTHRKIRELSIVRRA